MWGGGGFIIPCLLDARISKAFWPIHLLDFMKVGLVIISEIPGVEDLAAPHTRKYWDLFIVWLSGVGFMLIP